MLFCVYPWWTIKIGVKSLNCELKSFVRQDYQDVTGYFIFYFHNFPDESDEE